MAAIISIFAIGLVPPLIRPPTSDDAWLIYLARRILSGARLGIDYIEVTPPLAIWKSIPAVLLESATGVPAWTFTVLMIGALAALTLALAHRLLSAQGQDPSRVRLLLIAVAFAGLVIPGIEFSEREQFAFLLTTPYVVLVASRAILVSTDGFLGRLAGVLAGLGFSLKPHYLIAWALVETFAFRKLGLRRWRHPELRSLLVTGLIVIAATLGFAPHYLGSVLRLAPWYTAYLDNGFVYTLGMAGPVLLAIGVVGLAHRAVVLEPQPLRDTFGLAFAGFLLAAVAQRKGLGYHFLAAWGYGFLLLTVAWQTRPAKLSSKPSGLLLRLGYILLVAIPAWTAGEAAIGLAGPREIRHRGPDYSALLNRVRELGAGESLLLMSSNPAPAWPFALEAGGRWGSRYPCLWLMSAFYSRELRLPATPLIAGRQPGERPAVERGFIEEVLTDLEERRPRVIGVLLPGPAASEWGGAGRLDYLTYFQREPRFVTFMAQYREVEPMGGFRLWVRSGE